MLGWSRTLAPFWSGAIDRFAEVAALPEKRLHTYRVAADTAFDRMDDWWHGRVTLVKARRSEIDGAISFIRNTALRTGVAELIQAPVARHAAGALRLALHLATGSYRREQIARIAPGMVYDWACCRTLFPGDPSALLQHLAREMPERQRSSVSGPDTQDGYHLVFDRPAGRFGLRAEGEAVLAEAARIWDTFDDPLPWDLPEDIWTRRYDGSYHAMYHREMNAFHGRSGG